MITDLLWVLLAMPIGLIVIVTRDYIKSKRQNLTVNNEATD